MRGVRLVLVCLLACAAPAAAQPQVRNQPQAAVQTLSAWTSATSLNATQTIFGPGDAGFESVLVHLVQTTTLTTGAITFENSYDNANWVTIPADAVHDPTSTTWATIAVPYTAQASTNKAFLIHTKGWQGLRVKLSTAITGSGSITPNVTYLPLMPVLDVLALSPTAANFNDTANVAQFGGAAVVTGTGTSGSGIPRVTISSDSSLAANQSVNVAQINGVTTLMGNGATGTGSQRVTIASDNTAFSVNAQPATSGGTSTCVLQSAASTNATNCKNAAGQIYGYDLVNTTTTIYYLRLYNASSAPTCSSATGFVRTIPVPPAAASGQAGGLVRDIAMGEAYGTGVSFCLTGGGSSTDNTNAATGVYVAIQYK